MFFVYLFVLFFFPCIYQLCNEMVSGPEWVGGWMAGWMDGWNQTSLRSSSLSLRSAPLTHY